MSTLSQYGTLPPAQLSARANEVADTIGTLLQKDPSEEELQTALGLIQKILKVREAVYRSFREAAEILHAKDPRPMQRIREASKDTSDALDHELTLISRLRFQNADIQSRLDFGPGCLRTCWRVMLSMHLWRGHPAAQD